MYEATRTIVRASSRCCSTGRARKPGERSSSRRTCGRTADSVSSSSQGWVRGGPGASRGLQRAATAGAGAGAATAGAGGFAAPAPAAGRAARFFTMPGCAFIWMAAMFSGVAIFSIGR